MRRPFDVTAIWVIAFSCLLAAPAAPGTQPSYTWPVDPGPSWSVPRVSLPECLGLLEGYESEWWYYVGHVADRSGESYSIQLQAIRASVLPGDLGAQLIVGTVGIGIRSERSYLWSTGYGVGVAREPGGLAALVVPPVGDDAFEVSLQSWLAGGADQTPPSWRFEYAGGERVGAPGALYKISARGTGDLRRRDSAQPVRTEYSVEVIVKDDRGMVLEGSSGYVGPSPDNPNHGAATYEFAQPSLEVVDGSISIGGRSGVLDAGSLWLDRQVLTNPPTRRAEVPPATGDIVRSFGRTGFVKRGGAPTELYLGTWMGLVLDDGTSADLATFWREHPNQWLTGSMVGRPPLDYLGNVYLPVSEKMGNGGIYLRHGAHTGTPDFDVNVLRPWSGTSSPHWRSPTSGQSYATAWQVRFSNRLAGTMPYKTLYIAALAEPCENLLPDASYAFWEGSAVVYRDPELRHPIGHAFVEQMGFK